MVARTAFICNSSAHWFALRKVDKVWYNLNSTNRRMPEIISDFYLSAFLLAVKNCGYQVFSVEGEFPLSSEDHFEFYNKNQFWIPPKRIQKYHEKCLKRKGFKPNIGDGSGDKEMERALALSMGKKYEAYQSSGEDSDWDQDKKPELKEFGGKGASMGEQVFVNYSKFNLAPEEVEMAEFMKQSLGDQFASEPAEGVLVALRYPSGKKEQRMFEAECEVESLYDYVWHRRADPSGFYLVNYDSK